MKIVINNREIEVFIVKKRSNKNTYIRVKEDLNIYVTTNYYTKEKDIEKLIKDNINSIKKMFERQEKRKEKEQFFSYLGKKYDIVYLNTNDIIMGNEKILVPKGFDINKYLLKEAKKIFLWKK